MVMEDGAAGEQVVEPHLVVRDEAKEEIEDQEKEQEPTGVEDQLNASGSRH
jgi:hypothetical protein